MSVRRQVRAIAALPGTVVILVPILILSFEDDGGTAGIAVAPALVGAALVGIGFSVWLWTVRLFARVGRGTLAPWDPTRKLVILGPYRHVRNPMITAVATVLLGEAVLFGSPWLLGWALLFGAVNHVFFLMYEEPLLERRFGDEYRAYMREVPRWMPRRTPWIPRGPIERP